MASVTDRENMQKPGQSYNATEPDVTPRREGGDDAIAESSPLDSRADEIVFANEKRENSSLPSSEPATQPNETGT